MKLDTKPLRQQRLPGLISPLRRIEIEDVRSSHRLICSACGMVPKLRRLHVREGTGRSQSTHVYCTDCGKAWLQHRVDEFQRGISYFSGAKDWIRTHQPHPATTRSDRSEHRAKLR